MIKYNYQDKDKNTETQIKYLFNRTMAMFDYQNLPVELNRDLIELQLQKTGTGYLFKHGDKFYFLGGNPKDLDAYNNPVSVIITNQYLNLYKEFKIGVDCIEFKNDTQKLGLFPLFERASYIQSENDISIITAIINKRAQLLISANDDNTLQSAQQFLNKLKIGDIGVIGDSKLFDSLKVNNGVNSDLNLHELIELQQYIKASVFNDIGLSSNYNMKKERVTATEIETNSTDLYTLVDNMKHERELACQKANELFNLNLSVEFSSVWDLRYKQGEEVEKGDIEQEQEQKENESKSEVE